jgi:flagellar basal-body rod protein FlgG
MLATERKLDVSAHNLANVNTTGFKAELVRAIAAPEVPISRIPGFPESGRGFGSAAIGYETNGVIAFETVTDHSNGSTAFTGNPLDAAITGNGFFSILAADGTVRFTRNGSFAVDSEGFLSTDDGMRVLGQAGPIAIPAGASAQISSDGSVFSGGELLDSLSIVEFDDPQGLRRIGHNLFAADRPGTQVASKIEPGALEMSNANAIDSLIALIESHRAFEAGATAIQAVDSTLERAVNTAGVVG